MRTRSFDIYRGSAKIGTQDLTVSRSGSALRVDVDIDISVRILGVRVYRYTMSNQETWERGRLRTLKASCNDNGTQEFARAESATGGVQVEGSAYRGTVKGNPATTTYWTKAFMQRPTWINTQNGQPMNVPTQRRGTEVFPFKTGSVQAVRYDCMGDLDTLDLFYNAQNEWIGNRFVARGETAFFKTRRLGGALASLWVDG
ncbi:MAG: DUF6134 family protein [Pseudomonadota bacterium]